MSAATTVPSLAQGLANEPVSRIDLARYAGHWHEIAHLPMVFQRRCIDHVTADYTLRPDGKLDVRNVCRTRNDIADVAEGVARPAGGRAGALKVRFAPAWLAWLPFVWADYWVIDLDPAYRWAVVGSPSVSSPTGWSCSVSANHWSTAGSRPTSTVIGSSRSPSRSTARTTGASVWSTCRTPASTSSTSRSPSASSRRARARSRDS